MKNSAENLLASISSFLDPEDLERLSEHVQIIRAEEKREKKERKLKRKMEQVQLYKELVFGQTFEIAKVFLKDAPGGRLNDYAVVSDPESALALLEQYRKIGHNIKLYSLSLIIDGKLWKKYTFKYS